MKGRTFFIGFFIFLAIFAAGLFYSINFLHYDEAEHAEFEIAGLDVTNYREIDANTSPIKFRACFTLPEGTVLYGDADQATPLVAPYWFDCFDAKALTEDLQNGEVNAVAFAQNEPYGITSYLIAYPDGQAFAWRQVNPCGEAHFDEKPLPEGCPDPNSISNDKK